jgi:hypothetical protein
VFPDPSLSGSAWTATWAEASAAHVRVLRRAQGLLERLLEQRNRAEVDKKARDTLSKVQSKLAAQDYTSSWSESGFLNVQVPRLRLSLSSLPRLRLPPHPLTRAPPSPGPHRPWRAIFLSGSRHPALHNSPGPQLRIVLTVE